MASRGKDAKADAFRKGGKVMKSTPRHDLLRTLCRCVAAAERITGTTTEPLVRALAQDHGVAVRCASGSSSRIRRTVEPELAKDDVRRHGVGAGLRLLGLVRDAVGHQAAAAAAYRKAAPRPVPSPTRAPRAGRWTRRTTAASQPGVENRACAWPDRVALVTQGCWNSIGVPGDSLLQR